MTKEDEQLVNQMMEKLNLQDVLTHFNKLSDRCFDHCVADFQSSQLVQQEEACMRRCIEKFNQFSSRFQKTFVEQHTLQKQKELK